MKISVYNTPLQVLVQTIGVQKNPHDPDNTYLFSCPYCSHQIVQIQGTVSRISPGLDPTDSVVVINKCPRCEMRFVLQSTPAYHEITQVVLTRYLNPEPSFRCYICRTPLITFNKDIWLLAGMKQVDLPVSVVCPNAKCPAKYLVTDVV